MITIVLTIEEFKEDGSQEQSLDTNGTVVGLKATRKEEEMARALAGALEDYCVKVRMPITGGRFVRSNWPMRENGYAEAVATAAETKNGGSS